MPSLAIQYGIPAFPSFRWSDKGLPSTSNAKVRMSYFSTGSILFIKNSFMILRSPIEFSCVQHAERAGRRLERLVRRLLWRRAMNFAIAWTVSIPSRSVGKLYVTACFRLRSRPHPHVPQFRPDDAPLPPAALNIPDPQLIGSCLLQSSA